jgi:hypothetical protein
VPSRFNEAPGRRIAGVTSDGRSRQRKRRASFRAREYQSDAKVVFADGRMRVALGKTRVAAGLAKRAIRVVQGGAEL